MDMKHTLPIKGVRNTFILFSAIIAPLLFRFQQTVHIKGKYCYGRCHHKQ